MLHARILMALFLGLAFNAVSHAQFKEFSSKEGRFTVQMPGAPKESSQTASGVEIKLFIAEEKDGGYIVSYADMPVPAGETAEKLQERLDGARDGMVKNINGKLTNSSKILLDKKYPGRDVQASLAIKDGALHAKVYLVNGRLYQIMVVGMKPFTESENAKKFLDSLIVTK